MPQLMQYDMFEFRIRQRVEKRPRNQDRRIEKSEGHWRCYVARNEQLRLPANTVDSAKTSQSQLPLCWGWRSVCFQSSQLPVTKSKAHQHHRREEGPHDLECAQNPSRVNANQRVLNSGHRNRSTSGSITPRSHG